MSTLKSSGYRSLSTRAFNQGGHQADPDMTLRSHNRSRTLDTTRSHNTMRSKKSVKRSNGSYLRLNLVTNSKGLVQIDLANHRLVAIPIEVFLFSRLEVLKLSQNHFSEVPMAISRLRSLKFLYLDGNEITFLPETLPNCINLVEMNLTRNKLAALPTSLGLLKNLRVLKLGQNDFECLPHEIGALENLKYFDLHGNNLWYLPFSVQKLHKLKYLNLANNRFEHLPLPVCKITSLRTLNLMGNNLTNLLPDFDNLTQLLELNLSYNRFEIIPQSILRLRNIHYLNMTGNKLESIPNALTTLKALQVLHLQENNLDYIPDMFPNLQYLNVANNKLYNFSVVNMKRLKSLNANNNYLENIPMGMYSLSRVQSIRLNTNQISYVSSDIVQLKRLRTLDLGNNMLVNIPQVMKQFDRLDYFNIRGNNINAKISLHNGEISSQPDFHKKRRMYQSQRRGREPRRKYNTQRGQRSRSMESTMSRVATFPHGDNSHKMWDSEDLLQNGFSPRHLETNSNSAFLNQKHSHSNMHDNSYHSNRIHENSLLDESFRTYKRFQAHEAALKAESDDVSTSNVPAQTTDYRLLGICNQVEMLLNKQLLHPVLSLKGLSMGKSFSEKAIKKTSSGLWRISNDQDDELPQGLVATTTETFTVTPQGGWLTSSHDSNISIFLPPQAIIKVQNEKLVELRQKNRLISNIISLGPIVFLKNLDTGDFNKQVTITIPAPTNLTQGHLHLMSIREDSSCAPTSSGFQHKNGYIVLKAWNLA
ncbi:LRRC1-like protein, partial [Mya arenaria]